MVYKIYFFCICILIVVKEIICIVFVVGVKERWGIEVGVFVFKEFEGFCW